MSMSFGSSADVIPIQTPLEPRLQPIFFHEVTPYDRGGDTVEDLLQPGSLGGVVGASGVGKTFGVLDLGMSVARHTPWFGREVCGGPVLYLAAEAGESFRNREVAYRIHHGLEDATIQFASINKQIDLRSPSGDTADVISAAQWLGEKCETAPVLIIVDTLTAVSAGFDENTSADMTSLIGNLHTIRDETEAAILVVHHFGKDTSRGARGHSSFFAALDTEITVEKQGTHSVARVSKQRDLEGIGEFAFDLQVVEIAQRQNGKMLTSCVVKAVDRPASTTKEERLTKNQETVFGILHDAGTGGLSVAEWNAKAKEAGIGKKREADLWDIRTALKKKKLIYEFNDRWYVQK
jgi:RecA-family ATPase